MDFLPLCEQKKETLLRHRRYLHRHPELTGQETNTVRYIDESLTQTGIPHVVVENGGVLGFLRTGKNGGKTVLLRADCDALPIQEDPNNAKAPKTCVSLVPGVQHACGHDAHTACLLTAAEILWEHREEVPGDIIFCFERGEEGGGNLYYLLKYIEEHHIRVDGCFGLHVLAGGCTGAAEKRISRPGLSVINPHPCYEIARRALIQALGENRVQPWDAMMGSESFAYYSKLYPSFFLFYSIRNEEKGITIDCHKPGFDIDEDTLPGAAACHMAYALAFLQNPDPIPFTPLAGCVDDLFERTGRRP